MARQQQRPAQQRGANGRQETNGEVAIFDRAPPMNMEAECGVLGSMMLAADARDQALLIVKPDDFMDPGHRMLFQCMADLHEKGRGFDVVVLPDELRKRGQYEQIGGAAYIGKLLHAVPTYAHVTYYSEIVVEQATLRRLIEAATETLREAYSSPSDVQGLLGKHESAVAKISEWNLADKVTIPSADIMNRALTSIEKRCETGGIPGLSTGLVDLDRITGGLRPGEVTILAGRPSMGKTAAGLNIAANVAELAAAEQNNDAVMFVSLEMPAEQLGERLICSEARVNSYRLQRGFVNQEERLRIIEAAGKIATWPLHVDDASQRRVGEIGAMARRLKRQRGLRLVVVDYLQLVEADDDKIVRQEQVSKISRKLKQLARDLQVPLLVLCQVNRQVEQTRDNRPRLSNLRESGAIEQDADVVIFVHREEYYSDDPVHKGLAEMIVAKQRNGPLDVAKLCWLDGYTRFENLAQQRFDDAAPGF